LYLAADDGAVYFGFGSSGTGSNLYRYQAGAFTQTLPAAPANGLSAGGGVYGISVMPNHAVYWLSAYFGNQPFADVQVECGGSGTAALCGPVVQEPTSMALDATGALWVAGLTAAGGGEIATSQHQSFQSASQGVVQILAGPGGSIWGILRDQSGPQPGDSIVRFAAGAPALTIAQQVPLGAGALAGSMTLGSDGALWFTDAGRSAIGRVSLQGTLQEFPAPHAIAQPAYGESQIAAACDGSVWFSESASGRVVRVSESGAMTEYPLPDAQSYPSAVASGPTQGPGCTRVVWVGEARANRIASITY
jgi:virginiamycin B lyase